MKIHSAERDGRWVAYAVRDDTGDPFGLEFSGATAQEAIDRTRRWLEWQQAHAAALAQLQEAERSYHRTIAGSAFASPTEGPSAVELQRESLTALEAARARLDAIRAQKPE